MNTKAFFPCGGGSNLILGTGRENKIFFMNTHPAIEHIQSVTLTVHILTNPQTVTMSKYFILQTPTHPSNISKVSLYHCTCTHQPTNSYNVKIFHFTNTHPPIKHIQSVTLSLYMYSPAHKQLHCQNISFYKHPPTHQTYPKCPSVTVHVLTNPQTVTMSKYFILQTPTHSSNISKVSLCHCTCTHQPTNS